MMYPLVLDLAAKNAPVRVPIAVTCRVLGFSKRGFYQWRKTLSRNEIGPMRS